MKIFLLLVVCWSIGFASGRNCCPEKSRIIRKSKFCSDNQTAINLNCENGFFLLNPKQSSEDEFFVDESSNELTFLQGGTKISSTRFCTSSIPANDTYFEEVVVALVCFSKIDAEQDESFTVYFVLIAISTFFLLTTLIIYVSVPSLRDLFGKCLIAFMMSLALMYVMLMIIQSSANSSPHACIIQGFLMYFFSMSSFLWLNVITFNTWRITAQKGVEISDEKWFGIYCSWGFGLSTILVVAALLVDFVPGKHLKPNFGSTKCWFKGVEETWSFFYGPVALLLLINVILFVSTSWMLRKMDYSLKMQSLKTKFILHLKLFLLMGITWSFEVISFATPKKFSISYLWFVTDCLNCLQGIIIFLMLAVFRKKVRTELARNKMFGINWPPSWAQLEKEESGTSIPPAEEQIELNLEP